jgi:short-subunit dehydrogenase
MQIQDTRALVVGATGVLGGKIARQLHHHGAQVALAGRDCERLSKLSGELDDCAYAQFTIGDDFDPDPVLDGTVGELGGLDLLLVAVGVAAFGPSQDTEKGVTEELFRVNATAPIELARAAMRRMDSGGTVSVVSAVLADYPTAGMASYSASKAALSSWLSATRREKRRHHIGVFDIRPPHMDTGLAERAIAGNPPTMPRPADPDAVVSTIIQGVREDARELVTTPRTGELTLR